MKRILIFIVVFVLLFGFAGAFGYFQFVMKPEMIKGFIANAPRPVPAVAAVTATTQRWTPGLSAIGSTHAYQGIDVSSQLAGIVTAIHIGSGQDVAKGAPLFDLDTSVEEADLKNNLATLKNAELSMERQHQLTLSANTTKASMDAAEAARDSAAALVERTRRTIAQKTLVASFAGRLGIRKVDVGQYVSPGTGLITLQQLDPIFVDFPVPEQSLGLLKQGQPVNVTVDAYPGVTFTGAIGLIDARVATESRSVLVRAQFSNADHRLLPGMFANVTVQAGEPRDIVAVPRTAVSFSLYGDSVFVASPAPPASGGAQAAGAPEKKLFKIERRFVRTGEMHDADVAILQGVSAGETVISEGQIKLQNGALVTIDPKAVLQPPAIRQKE
ncbi:MAG: efflux RND transporter periplasmic adaptor subunit [Beijerinckiaceae bacterium]|jgi:membrane fusion protein (multidrug efflux system)